MLKTFSAILKNNSILWVDESPEIELDTSVKVHITLLEEIALPPKKSHGQKMSEALNKISKKNILAEIDPQKWQQEIRQDRFLPHRD